MKKMLYNILEEINSLNRTPAEVMEESINEKLEGSFNTYYESILETREFLLSKKTIRVLRGIFKEFNE